MVGSREEPEGPLGGVTIVTIDNVEEGEGTLKVSRAGDEAKLLDGRGGRHCWGAEKKFGLRVDRLGVGATRARQPDWSFTAVLLLLLTGLGMSPCLGVLGLLA